MGSPARLAVLLLLDLTALGRQEEWEEPKRRRDSARSARPDFASSPPPRDDGNVIFVALLRAINLGRVNRVPMGDLRVALTDAGFTEVVTHLQSGNVVLGSTKRSPTAVATAVERLVSAEFGVDIDVIVRTAADLAKIAATNPLAP